MVAPEDDDDASKTEEPSERKLTKAKEEGDVAVSQDAKSFIMLLGMLFLGSVQIFFIGMVGEYVLSINQRVMKRPLVIEEERLNFEKEAGTDEV